MIESTRNLFLTAGFLLAPGLAAAQEIGEASAITIRPQLYRSDAAGARFEPDFDPVPIPVGPLLVERSLSIVGGFDNNLLNRRRKEPAAVIALIPTVRVQTNLGRHRASVTAVGHIRRFSRLRSEDSEEFEVRADGRLDLIDRHTVVGSAVYAQVIEPRSSVGSVRDAAEPVSFARRSADIGANVVLGSLSISPSLTFSELDFARVRLVGGGSADQSFRNTRTIAADLAVNYELSGLLSAFAVASFADVNSTNAPARLARDSENLAVVVGLRGELSRLVVGELGVGFRSREYASPRYLDVRGPTYRADLQWYVTPLVTLRLQAQQTFQNSGNPQVAGILSNRVVASAYYDPLRNLRLSSAAIYEHNKYRETDTRARRTSLRVQGEFRLNRRLAVGAFASVLSQSVKGAPLAQPFTSFQTGLGVTLSL